MTARLATCCCMSCVNHLAPWHCETAEAIREGRYPITAANTTEQIARLRRQLDHREDHA